MAKSIAIKAAHAITLGAWAGVSIFCLLWLQRIFSIWSILWIVLTIALVLFEVCDDDQKTGG